jgi:hypothetical protein
MHQCLSCNQPCSLLSPFCDACRAALLARRDSGRLEEHPESNGTTTGNEGEQRPSPWEMKDGGSGLLTFPQPEAALVGAQTEQAAQEPIRAAGPGEENGSWSFQAPGLYAMETVSDLAESERAENRAEGARSTHVFTALPPRPRRTMPKNVKRALIVFCVVGALALVTDGILLALSLTRHHATGVSQVMPPDSQARQRLAPPVRGSDTLTSITPTPVDLLEISPQHLAFNAVQGQGSLAPQTITLAATHQGFAWRADASGAVPAWVHLSAWQGNTPPDTPASFTVSARPAGLTSGQYTTTLLIKAVDTQGKALKSSPLSLLVTLTVHPPCTLSVSPDKLTFASVLASEPSPQTLTVSAGSSCTSPVSWQVSSDASWVTFSRSSGTDSPASNSTVVQTSLAGKLIGTYTAHITFRGTDSSGAPCVVEPGEITVTLTVIA